MGKKNKNNGPPYKPTSRKFFVVEKAWTDNIDHIAAWFEIMIRAKYPDVRVEAIYRQSSALHGCCIVELPREVEDIRSYLGEHLYSRFLRHKPLSMDASFIYEYDYRNHGKPEVKWNSTYPSNRPIPPDFPVIDPYPLPIGPFLNPENRPNFALRLPPQTHQVFILPLPQALLDPPTPVETPIPSASLSTIPSDLHSQGSKGQSPKNKRLSPEVQRMPSSMPAYTFKEDINWVKKIDPYEEAEVAQELLRSLSPVKKEGDAVDDFLSSLLPSTNTEESKPLRHVETPLLHFDADTDTDQGHAAEEYYKPSSELLELFSEVLSQDEVKHEVKEIVDRKPTIIKPEPEDVKMPDYEPSAELLAAFSNLSEDYFDHPGSSLSRSSTQLQVKQECEEVIHDMCHSHSVTVKEEPVDFSISPDPRIRHQDNYVSSNLANTSNTVKRTSAHLLNRGTKRIKIEEE